MSWSTDSLMVVTRFLWLSGTALGLPVVPLVCKISMPHRLVSRSAARQLSCHPVVLGPSSPRRRLCHPSNTLRSQCEKSLLRGVPRNACCRHPLVLILDMTGDLECRTRIRSACTQDSGGPRFCNFQLTSRPRRNTYALCPEVARNDTYSGQRYATWARVILTINSKLFGRAIETAEPCPMPMAASFLRNLAHWSERD